MSTTKRIGIYPGSFDPLTYGHLNLIERASKLFDEIIVLIAINTSKKALFNEEERTKLVKESIKNIPNARVDVMKDGLVASYYEKVGASALVRGVRNSTDYEYEFGIASANHKQYDQLETVVLFAADEYRFLSSSLIKEIAYFHGNISDMVPPNVEEAMKEKYKN